MIGKVRPGAPPVVGGDADPPPGGQVIHQRQRLLSLVPDDPATAVDLEQHRRLADAGARGVDVELMPSAGAGGVLDAARHPHLAVEEEEWNQLPPRGVGCSQTLGDVGQDPVGVVRTQRLLERRLDHRGGARRDAPQGQQPDPGPQRDAQTHPAGPRFERAGPDEEDRRGELPGEVVSRELRGEPAREEARKDQRTGPSLRDVGVEGEPRADQGDDQEEPGHARYCLRRGGRGKACGRRQVFWTVSPPSTTRTAPLM